MLTYELRERKLDSLDDKSINESTVEECIIGCREAARIRDMMSGAMHWNMLNEQCHMLYDACKEKGAEDEVITELYRLLR